MSNAPSCSLGERLLGTPNEEMWPGVGKLPNWHVYPQWKPTKLSTLVPGLDSDGYDLLEVSEKLHLVQVYQTLQNMREEEVRDCEDCVLT